MGAGKGKRWIEAREIQRRNRTETSISSSCHSLFLYFSTSVALSRENIACFSFFSKLSLGWIRIDRNARAENDRSRPNCLRVATKTFRAEGRFRVAETVARLFEMRLESRKSCCDPLIESARNFFAIFPAFIRADIFEGRNFLERSMSRVGFFFFRETYTMMIVLKGR